MDLKGRMELYESVYVGHIVQPRTPVIMRLDGRAFHSILRRAEKPFDGKFASRMDIVGGRLLQEIQNARCAYLQSDEISILLIDYNRHESQQWFGGNIMKMVSVSASVASSCLSAHMGREVHFDSRVFAVPEREVVNYFIWRQRDWERNSIQMVARHYYSHKQTEGKNGTEMQEMIFQKGDNWNDYSVYWRRGRVVTPDGEVDNDVPIFSRSREYVEKFMAIEEE